MFGALSNDCDKGNVGEIGGIIGVFSFLDHL